MSKKRFKLSSETVLQYQIMDNDTDLNESEVVGLLNEQQDKITELEIELTDCKNRKEQSEYNLHKKISELENQFEKIPPKIRGVWLND